MTFPILAAARKRASDDPYWDNTVLLMRGTTNLKNLAITTINGTTTSTSIKKFGTDSTLFDGTNDYMSVSGADQDFHIFGNDYTMELWFYLTANTAVHSNGVREARLVYRNVSGSPANVWDLAVAGDANSTGTGVSFAANPANVWNSVSSIGTTVTKNEWHNVVVTIKSSVLCMYYDGVLTQKQKYMTMGTTNRNDTVYIGATNLGAGWDFFFPGYMDELRLTKGVCRYNYTTTDPYWENVVLMMPMEGPDNATSVIEVATGKSIVRGGSALLRTPTKKYGNSSSYFDGASYWQTSTGPSDFAFGTGPFTIECWVNITAGSSGPRTVMDKTYTWNSSQVDFRIEIDSSGYFAFVGGPSNTNWFSTSPYAIPTGQWVHLAVSRGDGYLRLFVDGVKKLESSDSAINIGNQQGYLRIGCMNNSNLTGNYFRGYIDDLRITKGVNRYTDDFTPTQCPIPTITVQSAEFPTTRPSYDYFWSNTTLLLRNSTTDEKSNHSFSTFGGVSQSATRKYGDASLQFNGTTGYVRYTEVGEEFTFGTGDFTVEAWINVGDTANRCIVCSDYSSTVNGLKLFTATNTLKCSIGDGTYTLTVTSAASIVNNTWHHVAVVRSGSFITAFIDGVPSGATVISSVGYLANASYFFVGANSTPGQYFLGYIDDLRVTKGVARYTTKFTPPTAELPVGTNFDPYWNSVLSLMNFNGTLIDLKNRAWTAVGDPTFSNGILQLDGNGDWITTPSTTEMSLATGDFTVEFWASITTIPPSGNRVLYHHCPHSNSGSVSTLTIIINSSGVVKLYASTDGISFVVNGVGVLALTQGVLTHIAASRTGNTFSVWIGGVLSGTQDQSGTLYVGSNPTRIGSVDYSVDPQPWPGTVDSFRLTKGVSRYSTASIAFSPPIEGSLTLDSVTSLLKFNSGLTDELGNIWTAVGSPTVSGSSLVLGGTSDWIQGPSFNTATGDFTVELKATITGTPNVDKALYHQSPNSNSGSVGTILLQTQANTNIMKLYVSTTGTSWEINALGTLAISGSTHIAVTRTGNLFALWINGALSGYQYLSGTLYVGTNPTRIGAMDYSVGTRPWIGSVEYFRLTTGLSRYPVAFTPPTTFPTM